MSAGLHLVTVKSIKYKKNKVNQVALYPDGMPQGYDVRLQNALHQSKTLSLSYNPKLLFMMESFLKALGLDMTGHADGNDILDKKLWIIVRKELWTDPTGQPKMESGVQKMTLGVSSLMFPADKKPLIPESEFTIQRKEA